MVANRTRSALETVVLGEALSLPLETLLPVVEQLVIEERTFAVGQRVGQHGPSL